MIYRQQFSTHPLISHTLLVRYSIGRSVAHISQCTGPISHDAPLCYRNVHPCGHFGYKMVHCGIFACSMHCKFVKTVSTGIWSGQPSAASPATGTWRNDNVIVTSKTTSRRRFDVIMALILRRVSARMYRKSRGLIVSSACVTVWTRP